MDEERPIKAKNLKIIDQMGTLYATFDGEKIWKMDKLIYKLLNECDGKKTFNDIARMISRKSGIDIEDIKIGLKGLFNDLEKRRFIEYV